MSKLGLLIDAASLATEITMASNLGKMQQQGMAAPQNQQFIHTLRDHIFKYNEATKNILDFEARNPKIAAGAMRLLEMRIMSTTITPDLFFELNDKEYVSNTIRTIKENARRLTNQLAEADRQDVENTIAEVSRISDYSYYLDNVEKLQEYKNNLEASQGSGSGLRLLGFLGIGLGLAIPCFASFSLMFTRSSGGSSAYSIFGLIIIICAFIAIAVGQKGVNAKKNAEKIRGFFDLEQLEHLDAEFHGDTALVRKRYQTAQDVLKNFFGDANLLLP